MADVFSKKKRSQVMAAIRSKGNKDTELKLASILRAHGIKGWRRHQPLPGKELSPNSQSWWSRDRCEYLLNQMSPKHRAQAEAMIKCGERQYERAMVIG